MSLRGRLPVRSARVLRKLALALFLLCAATRDAEAGLIIYSDNFDQFALGTDLTSITYTPAVGQVNSATLNTFEGTSTKTAVNFGGSRAVEIQVPKDSGIEYVGGLPGAYSNTVLQFRWDTTFASLNDGLGGYFIRFPSPVFGMQVLMGYLDDGRITVFDGPPSLATIVPIGTFDAGVTYRTRLDVDLRNDVYSVYVDGAPLLLNAVLLDYVNQTTFDRFGFEADENTPSSAGNTWYIDNISVAVAAVPEPPSLWVMGVGVAFATTIGRRRVPQIAPENLAGLALPAHGLRVP